MFGTSVDCRGDAGADSAGAGVLSDADSAESHLYNFEVQVHHLHRFRAQPPGAGAGTGGLSRLRAGFRLWDFPAVTVACDDADGAHGASADAAAAAPMLLVERGKTCLFEAVPAALAARLPLPLACVLFSERAPGAQRARLASAEVPVGAAGAQAATLDFKTARDGVVLHDGFGSPYCEVVCSVRLVCVGPYRGATHPASQPPVAPVSAGLHPGSSVAAFVRHEVAPPLAALQEKLFGYADLTHLTLEACCGGDGGGGVAASVFTHQVSLLQQLQHNTQKLLAIVDEEHVRLYGAPAVPNMAPSTAAAGTAPAAQAPPVQPHRRRQPQPKRRGPRVVAAAAAAAEEVSSSPAVDPDVCGAHAALYVLVAGATAAAAAAAAAEASSSLQAPRPPPSPQTSSVPEEVVGLAASAAVGGGGGSDEAVSDSFSDP